MRSKDFPWIFWFRINIRKDWFSYWWTTSGANFREFQIWIFYISIGQPWYKPYLDNLKRDYGSTLMAKQTNDGAKKHNKIAFQIGKYNTSL